MDGTQDKSRFLLPVLLLTLALTGCTSLRNTVPARGLHLPDVYQAPRSSQRPLNFMLLRQDRPDAYVLMPGDVLGVYIERILGSATEAPPVHYPDMGTLPPSIGFPIPVREDGTIALPLVPPLRVQGLTLNQAHQVIEKAYTIDRQLLPAGTERVLVSLIRPRTYHVLVVREDTVAGPRLMGSERQGEMMLGRSKRGEAFSIKLPAYENDVLGALSRTGGLPGVDAKNQVTIIRGGYHNARQHPILSESLNGVYAAARPAAESESAAAASSPMRVFEPPAYPVFPEHYAPGHTAIQPVSWARPPSAALAGNAGTTSSTPTYWPYQEFPHLLDENVSLASAQSPVELHNLAEAAGRANIITIPLRVGPYDQLPELSEEDIVLRDGDVIFVESRDAEVFYTGGLLTGGQHPIPRDYDLDVLGAIAMAGGSISAAAGGTAGGFNSAVGTIVPPSRITIVRQYQGQQVAIRTSVREALSDPRERILIQPNDLVLLEYTPGEVWTNLIISNLRVTFSLNSLWN